MAAVAADEREMINLSNVPPTHDMFAIDLSSAAP